MAIPSEANLVLFRNIGDTNQGINAMEKLVVYI